MHCNNQPATLWGTEGTGEEGPLLWMVPVCGQMGRCGHWLAGQDSSFTLSQVSRHVRLSIVSGQQLPLQGARPLLKGTSRTVCYSHQQVPKDQTSNFFQLSILVSALLSVVRLSTFLHSKLQRIQWSEFSIEIVCHIVFFLSVSILVF